MSDAVAVTTESQPDEYVEQQPEKPTVVSLLVGIVIDPQATFKNLREMEKGYWWLVFLITVAAVILYTVVSTSVSANAMSRAMQDFTPPEGVATGDAAANMPQVTQSSSLITVVVPLLSGIIMILFGYAFRSLIAFGGSMVMGGNSTFKQTFRMAVWSTIPAIFRNIVRSIAVVTSQGRIIEGLTGVMTTLEARSLPVLNLLLGQVDFYAVWSMVLLGIGVAVTTRLGKNKSIVAVLFYIVTAIGGLLLYYVISNAIGGLAGSQQGPGMMRGPRG